MYQIGAEIAAIIMESEAFDYLDAPVERITGADVPMPYSIPIEKLALPQADDIERAVRRTLARKQIKNSGGKILTNDRLYNQLLQLLQNINLFFN